ncbi:hypothetical protein [Pseudoalteromonas phenolica]|uniref:hypothetical protein n=1 Tax=Pseudoalteromonas phenolica TaxID=161398 RepID=UPI00110ABB21|nr:hypothetical protein [Pseudoalteromonas phenolica]TMO53211.1 hypothetical protein CWC21_20760 [Pseudoalteromonas phenolica]
MSKDEKNKQTGTQAKSIALWCNIENQITNEEPDKHQLIQTSKSIVTEELSRVTELAKSNFLNQRDGTSEVLHIRDCLNDLFSASVNELFVNDKNFELQTESLSRFNNFGANSLCDAIKGISLHINYWHFSFEPDKPDILDIGLMIPRITGLKELSLYLPMNLKKSDIKDITKVLMNNEISTAIFNENLSYQQNGTRDHFKLLKGGKYFCTLRSFLMNYSGDEAEFEFREVATDDNNSEGVIISIKEKAITKALSEKHEEEKAYFRLRVMLDTKDKKDIFVRRVLPRDKYLVSGFEVTEYIDFRINETRLLPQSVQEEIESQQGKDVIPVKRIDFLLATTPSADIKISGKSFHKSRYLESNPWKSYLKGSCDKIIKAIDSGMVVYHWKSSGSYEEPIEDFLAFVKLRVRLSQRMKILFYLLLIVFLGSIGSLLAGFINDLYKASTFFIVSFLIGLFIKKFEWIKNSVGKILSD